MSSSLKHSLTRFPGLDILLVFLLLPQFCLCLPCGCFNLSLTSEARRTPPQSLGCFSSSTCTFLVSVFRVITLYIDDLQVYISNPDLFSEFQALLVNFFLVTFHWMLTWHLEMNGLPFPPSLLLLRSFCSMTALSFPLLTEMIMLSSLILFSFLYYILPHLSNLLPLP